MSLSYEAIQSKAIPVSYEAIESKGIKVSYEAIESKGIKVSYEAIQQGHSAEAQTGEESQKNRFGEILKETMETASSSSSRGQALASVNLIGGTCFDLSSLSTRYFSV